MVRVIIDSGTGKLYSYEGPVIATSEHLLALNDSVVGPVAFSWSKIVQLTLSKNGDETLEEVII